MRGLFSSDEADPLEGELPETSLGFLIFLALGPLEGLSEYLVQNTHAGHSWPLGPLTMPGGSSSPSPFFSSPSTSRLLSISKSEMGSSLVLVMTGSILTAFAKSTGFGLDDGLGAFLAALRAAVLEFDGVTDEGRVTGDDEAGGGVAGMKGDS